MTAARHDREPASAPAGQVPGWLRDLARSAGQVALCYAKSDAAGEPMRIVPEAIEVETRGAGNATRRIRHVIAPEFPAQRLLVVEVLTPSGNWSSYPPHKHDDTPGSLADNEEIYYFRLGRTGSVQTSAEGFALHRTYTADGSIDETVVVRDGDAFLVPRGYHGPCVAAPGYPLYYLNVMAGPNPERTMATVDDPAYAWIRAGWDGAATDPRCPLTSAAGAAS